MLVADMSSAMKSLLIYLCVSTVVFWHNSDAYSMGPPSSVCRSMMPSHRAEPNTDPSPYVITFSRRSQQQQRVDVTISSPGGSTFKGFLLKAKKATGPNAGQTVGTFYNPPRYSAMKLSCSRTAMCHSASRQQNSITATWRAPRPTTDEPVVFVATVVQSFRNFWANVTSEQLDLSA